MSKYSDISKKIGWDDRKVSIPTLKEAEQLHDEVLNLRSESAFEHVFVIHRFAPSPDGFGEDFEAMKLVNEAFTFGTQIFSK